MADETVKATAAYQCRTKIGPTDYFTTTNVISIPVVANEKPEDTLKRFQTAAEKLNGNYTQGCEKKTFKAFLGNTLPPKVIEYLKKIENEKKAKETEENPKKTASFVPGSSDICIGEWRGRSVCKR